MDKIIVTNTLDGKPYEFDRAALIKELGLADPAKTANLEKSMSAWMDTEVMGVPVVAGVVGGAVAELASALISKIPQLNSYGVMVTDLAAALALGWAAKNKKWEWAKYGAMFLVFAAFQSQVQSLVSQVAGMVPSGGGAATTTWAQSNDDVPAAVERWLRTM